MRNLSRFVLITTLVAAPWMIGGVPLNYQLIIGIGVLLSLALWTMSVAFEPLSEEVALDSFSLPFAILTAFGLLGCLQLVEFSPATKVQTAWNQELGIEAYNSRDTISIAPAATRLQVARYMLVLIAFFLGTQLFTSPQERFWFYAAFALCGASLALFGMAQRLTWNGQLFWTIPLRYGGQPFASFVNRNNAAGFLNICLAASLGGLVQAATSSHDLKRQSRIYFAVCIACIIGGIVTANSRGGILVAGIAGLFIIPQLAPLYGKNFWVGLGLITLMAGSLLAWNGFQEAAWDRLQAMSSFEQAMGIRMNHWRDTFQAVLDRPLLGGGWGTYRYLNRPYQTEVAPGWFWNADNEYFEILVESGAIGLGLTIAFILAFAFLLRRLWNRGTQSRRFDIFVTATFMFLAIGVQQLTDFGITILPIALGAALLAAMTTRAGTETAFITPTMGDRARSFVTGLILCMLGGLAGFEVYAAAEVENFAEKLPPAWDEPDLLTPLEAESLIVAGDELLKLRGDDAELNFAVANLCIYRFRLGMVDANPGLQTKIAWRQSQPARLYFAANLAERTDSLNSLREQPLIQQWLRPAYEHLVAANNFCAWLPDLQTNLAELTFLNPEKSPQAKDHLYLAASLAANEPERLLIVAELAFHSQATTLGIECCQRILTLSPDMQDEVIAIARVVLDDRVIAAEVLATPEQVIAFAQNVLEPAALESIQERLERMITTTSTVLPTGKLAWCQAHVSLLRGDKASARSSLETAVQESPLDLDWRLELAGVLMDLEDWSAAKEQLDFAKSLSSRDTRIELLSRKIHDKLDEH